MHTTKHETGPPEQAVDTVGQETSAGVENEHDRTAGHHRQLVRIAYYSAALSLAAAIGFVWVTSYYAIALDTRISEANAATLQQVDLRLKTASPRPQPPAPVQLEVPGTAARLGNSSARLTVVEFADFQCPFCGRFHAEVFQKLKTEYVDTGKISLVYMDFAFLGEESRLAAQAAKCAGDQGKFWEYHDLLFQSQDGENQGAFVSSKLKAFAKKLGLQAAAFNSCLDLGTHANVVQEQTALGRSIGVSGTPSVVIGSKLLVGAQDYSVFKGAIDEALAK